MKKQTQNHGGDVNSKGAVSGIDIPRMTALIPCLHNPILTSFCPEGFKLADEFHYLMMRARVAKNILREI